MDSLNALSTVLSYYGGSTFQPIFWCITTCESLRTYGVNTIVHLYRCYDSTAARKIEYQLYSTTGRLIYSKVHLNGYDSLNMCSTLLSTVWFATQLMPTVEYTVRPCLKQYRWLYGSLQFLSHTELYCTLSTVPSTELEKDTLLVATELLY